MTSPGRAYWMTATLQFLAGALVLFLRLGATPIERTSEKRCHEVAVTMLESGDWLVPMYNGETRLQKPPLYYWMAAASAKLLGGPSGFSTRLPSALATLATALLILAWTRRHVSSEAALVALGLFVTMNQFPSAGRRGDAETTLMATSLLALFAFHRFAATQHRKDAAAFGLATALAVFSKATAAFLTVLAPIAVWLWRGAPRLPRPSGIVSRTLLWFAIGTAVGLAWYGVIVATVPGAFDTLIGDLLLPSGVNLASDDDSEHYRAPWYYVSKLFAVGAPASLFIPVVIWRAISTRGYASSPTLRFVALAFCAEFVAFSILPQKQRHYLLPMLPLLAILAADGIVCLARERAAIFDRIARFGGIAGAILGVTITTVMVLFLRRLEPEIAFPWIVAPVVCAIGFVAAAILLSRRSTWRGALVLALSAAGTMALFDSHVKVYQATVDAALENDEPVPEEAELFALERDHPWLVKAFDLDGLIEDLHERYEPKPP